MFVVKSYAVQAVFPKNKIYLTYLHMNRYLGPSMISIIGKVVDSLIQLVSMTALVEHKTSDNGLIFTTEALIRF